MPDNKPFIKFTSKTVRLSPLAGTYFYAALIVLVMAFTIFFGYRQGGGRIRIDFTQVQKEFSRKVFGQNNTTDQLIKAIRQSFTDVLSERSNFTLIFLVGGPGVGKHHTLNIIRKNMYCKASNETHENIKEDKLYAWDKILHLHPIMDITNNVFKCNESSISFIDIKPIDEDYIYTYQNTTKLMNKFLTKITEEKSMMYIITGPILKIETLKDMNCHEEYVDYLNKTEDMIERSIPNYIAKHNVYVIKFNPMKYEDVCKSLSIEKNLGDDEVREILKQFENDTDFVPQGCHID